MFAKVSDMAAHLQCAPHVLTSIDHFLQDDASSFHALFSTAKNSMPCSYRCSASDAWAALKKEGKINALMENQMKKPFARYWNGYAEYLASCDALDYDDILSFAVAVLRQCPDVTSALAAHWRYILADECESLPP
jgi:superfamily I DNA/RNA helicase